jgi:hypothetical protein
MRTAMRKLAKATARLTIQPTTATGQLMDPGYSNVDIASPFG